MIWCIDNNYSGESNTDASSWKTDVELGGQNKIDVDIAVRTLGHMTSKQALDYCKRRNIDISKTYTPTPRELKLLKEIYPEKRFNILLKDDGRESLETLVNNDLVAKSRWGFHLTPQGIVKLYRGCK